MLRGSLFKWPWGPFSCCRTNPVEFEAYLAQFPNGVFRALAEARLAALRAPARRARKHAAATAVEARPSSVAALVGGYRVLGGDVANAL